MSAAAVKYVRQLQEVKQTRRHVMAELAWLANEKGECWASITKLAEWTGWSGTAVKVALQWLKANGYLTQTKRGRANAFASEYRLTFKAARPEDLEAATAPRRDASRPYVGTPAAPQYGSNTEEKNKPTNQQEEEGEAKRASAPSLAIVSKQNPSLPSERSEDSEETQKFRRKRDALVKVSPPGASLEEWLTKLQYVCDNSPALAGIDVAAAWESCCAYREARGLRRPTRQDFAGWLLTEWRPAEGVVMGAHPQRYAAAC
jgi:biotin operon repressor